VMQALLPLRNIKMTGSHYTATRKTDANFFHMKEDCVIHRVCRLDQSKDKEAAVNQNEVARCKHYIGIAHTTIMVAIC